MDSYKTKSAVAILTFNRTKTTQKLLDIMKIVQPPRLYVIIDAPRKDKLGESEQVEAVKAIFDQVNWECDVYKNFAEKNMGTCMRQYTGFSWVFENEESAIIFEDDCIPSLDFFRFCDEMLEKYKDDERVMMVSGSNYLTKWETGNSYHFSSMGGIWGWASWSRAWKLNDIDIMRWRDENLRRIIRSKIGKVQYEHRKEAWDNLCCNSENAKTWDFQWWFARTINDGLTIIPCVNLVSNIGFDAGAVHTTAAAANVNLPTFPLEFPLKSPDYVIEDKDFDKQMYNLIFRGSIKTRVKRRIKSIFRSITKKY